MSFCVDLWGCYDSVISNFSSNRRGIRDFLHMLRDIYDLEIEYAKGNQRILDYKYSVTNHNNLSQGINAFRNDIQNQINYHLDFANSIKEEIITPLAEFYDRQTEFGRNLNLEVRSAEKLLYEQFTRVENLKSRFHTSAKEAERLKLELELKKGKKTPEIAKLEKTSQLNLKEAKDNERLYIINLNQANIKTDIYNDLMKKCYIKLQDAEEEYISFIKDCMRKYLVYQVAINRNMQYDIDKKASIIEGVSVRGDILHMIESIKPKFSNSNSSLYLPISKIDFEPYKSEIKLSSDSKIKNITISKILNNFDLQSDIDKEETEVPRRKLKIVSKVNVDKYDFSLNSSQIEHSIDYKDKEENKENEIVICNDSIIEKDKVDKVPEPIVDRELVIKNEVKEFIRNVFFRELPDFNVDNMDYKNYEEIRSIVEYAWEGKMTSDDEKQIIASYLKDKRYRNFFVSCLKRIKNDRVFGLSNQAYECFSKLILISLDYMLKYEDYENIIHINDISQSFYKVAMESNKPRLFLNDAISTHNIFKNESIWNGLIKYLINEDLLNSKANQSYMFISLEERQEQVRKLIKEHISTIMYIMLRYNISKFTIRNIILTSAYNFELKDQETKEISKVIDEFKLQDYN